MKNSKLTIEQRLEQIREEIIDMIIANEYDFIGIKKDGLEWSSIEIEVGGLVFRWSLHIERKLLAEHSFEIRIGDSKRIEEVANHLINRHYKVSEKDLIMKKIKELEEQLNK